MRIRRISKKFDILRNVCVVRKVLRRLALDVFTLLLRISNVCAYAYVCVSSVKQALEMLSWFSSNGMKANPDKCHFLLNGTESYKAKIGGHTIESSKQQKLLGVIIDNKLTFEKHLDNLCNRASQKLNALCRVSSYMSTEQKRMIMKAFINSQFGYCPLVWMNHSRKLNQRINKIHERALRVVYNDKHASFEELLSRDKSATVHVRNLQVLVTEMFKVKLGISPVIMKDIFQLRKCNYRTRNFDEFVSHCVKTVYYGTETVSFLGPKLWTLLPQEFKDIDNLPEFKSRIKSWVPHNCPCRLCKTYIHQLGFI